MPWKHFPLTGLLWGVHRSPMDLTKQRAGNTSFDGFFYVSLNKPSKNKSSNCRWFKTPCRSLWRHCNDVAKVSSNFYCFCCLTPAINRSITKEIHRCTRKKSNKMHNFPTKLQIQLDDDNTKIKHNASWNDTTWWYCECGIKLYGKTFVYKKGNILVYTINPNNISDGMHVRTQFKDVMSMPIYVYDPCTWLHKLVFFQPLPLIILKYWTISKYPVSVHTVLCHIHMLLSNTYAL